MVCTELNNQLERKLCPQKTFIQETKATTMYQEREVYFCIREAQSLPLSPGLPG